MRLNVVEITISNFKLLILNNKKYAYFVYKHFPKFKICSQRSIYIKKTFIYMKEFRMNLKSPITQFCGDFADVQKLCNSLFHSFLIPLTILDILHEKENYGFFFKG